MTILTNMGKQQSKNAQVIIAQTGADNTAKATSTLENKVELYGILMVITAVFVFSVCFYFVLKKCTRYYHGKFVDDLISRTEKGRTGTGEHGIAPPTTNVTATNQTMMY